MLPNDIGLSRSGDPEVVVQIGPVGQPHSTWTGPESEAYVQLWVLALAIEPQPAGYRSSQGNWIDNINFKWMTFSQLGKGLQEKVEAALREDAYAIADWTPLGRSMWENVLETKALIEGMRIVGYVKGLGLAYVPMRHGKYQGKVVIEPFYVIVSEQGAEGRFLFKWVYEYAWRDPKDLPKHILDALGL